MEDKRKLTVAGLELNGRIDRMDELESGGHALIDYKTGNPTPNDWQGERPEDPQLLAALGRLCAHAELWGKSESYLEASLAFEESRATHLELARLLDRHGRGEEAQKHYRRAAELP